MDLRIIDFPEYPWKTLNVHKDFSYTFNISPGKKIEGDLFDSSKMKVVSYNKSTDTGKWVYGFLSFSILPEGTKTDLSLRTRREYILRKTAAVTTYGLKPLGSSPDCVIKRERNL